MIESGISNPDVNMDSLRRMLNAGKAGLTP